MLADLMGGFKDFTAAQFNFGHSILDASIYIHIDDYSFISRNFIWTQHQAAANTFFMVQYTELKIIKFISEYFYIQNSFIKFLRSVQIGYGYVKPYCPVVFCIIIFQFEPLLLK